MTISKPHPLNGCIDRIDRTNEHLADLRRLIANTSREHENAVGVRFDPQPPHHFLPVLPPAFPTPYRVGVLIGEICYNLRSCLDYLVFELARLDSGVVQHGTQFPIEDAPEKFRGRANGGYLRGVNVGHVAAIERLQPYAGCAWTGLLRDLSNPDKHRELVGIKGDFSIWIYSRLTDPNFDEIVGSECRAMHPIHGDLDMKVHFVENVLFMDGAPVVETLEKLKLNVVDTLEALKAEF